MKNVQVVDDGDNCYYPVYALTNEEFRTVFPEQGQDIEFIEDVSKRLGEHALPGLFKNVWPRLQYKSDIAGVHGTLFYQLLKKKQYCLTKREAALSGQEIPKSVTAASRNVQIISGRTDDFYSIYALTDDEFLKLFPDLGQDVEFIEDAAERLGEPTMRKILQEIRSRQIEKQKVIGLHGTLFEGLRVVKKKFYPNKRDSDISG